MSAFAWRLLINVIGIGLGFCVLPGTELSNFAGLFLAALLFGVINGLLLPFFLLAKRQLDSIKHVAIFFGLSCALDGVLLILAKVAIKGFVLTGFFNLVLFLLFAAGLNTLSSWLRFPDKHKSV